VAKEQNKSSLIDIFQDSQHEEVERLSQEMAPDQNSRNQNSSRAADELEQNQDLKIDTSSNVPMKEDE
jgi:hypothetical protein